MTAYPLLQILLYLSLLFAPPDATRVTITGPTPAESLELRVTVNGWAMVRDGAETPISLSEGRLLEKKGDKYESTDLSAHLAPIKGHDWAAAPKLTLAEMATLEKTDAGFVFRHGAESDGNARAYTIAYHLPAPGAPTSAISVNVIGGGVNNPGAYRLEQGASLLHAITAAGGMNRVADRSRVRITRGPAGTQPTTLTYNVAKIISGGLKAPELQDHDTVFVPDIVF